MLIIAPIKTTNNNVGSNLKDFAYKVFPTCLKRAPSSLGELAQRTGSFFSLRI